MHHTKTIQDLPANKEFISEFAKDVYIGLSDHPKWLSSKYFYDDKGDHIFQQIMAMDSYYLTNCEQEIFEKEYRNILQAIGTDHPFRIIELGAGDGKKTRFLLEHFVDEKINFSYAPCDISMNVLQLLQRHLRQEIPNLEMELMHGDYFKVLSSVLKREEDTRNVVFFLGANIGNFSEERAKEFIRRVRNHLHTGDLFMIGFDLKKDPDIILNAYNDDQGITASFNYNLLERINRELQGNFNPSSFLHKPVYNPETGECRSYLVSLMDQSVHIGALEKTFDFQAWETIFMEISRKYSRQQISSIGDQCGFEEVAKFNDSRGYFQEVLWRAVD